MNRALVGVAIVAAAIASGMATAFADPATDDRGFVDSTARCTAPATAVAFGYTTSSRIAVCKDPAGQYEYRGVRVSDGAKLVAPAKPTDGGYVAANDGITYTVTSKALIVKAGDQVVRDEPMVDFHGQGPGAAPAPAPPPQQTQPQQTQPSAAPETPTPTTPLPPPLPAEVGGG